ncbi:DsbC family protein [Verticiella alkaliphila]|uniref:DsbC family protein n=1 Tax=Verticiella alkaliphila TaxID=2779529 RepID=UPI00353012B1
MQGALVDAESRRNLTTARLEQLNAVAFSDLPMELAFTQVRGNGSRHIAVFEDPNCGYCKQFRRTLLEVDDITVHTFMYPMLAPDSADKVRDVWCAKDKAAAWDAWMIEGKRPATASCDAPLPQMVALGQKLRVRGTPTIIFADGTRVGGALPRAAFEERLAKVAAR